MGTGLSHHSSWRRWAVSALLIALTGILAGHVRAQSLSEREARIAYLYNFAKFVEWPADALPPRAAISFCVLGDHSLGGELENAARGREIAGHRVLVSTVTPDGALRACHLLYVTGLDQKRTSDLLAATTGAPVFTVSDEQRFAERGGVATLVFEGGRPRFAFNVDMAQRAHLVISSRLLALASIIKDKS